MPLNNFGIVELNSLYRCAQPDKKGFEDLYKLGVRKIFKLNTESEYSTAKEKSLFAGEIYPASMGDLTPNYEEVISICQAIRRSFIAGEKSAVHCTHGRDRTGLIIGSYRILFNNWNLVDTIAEFEIYGVVGVLHWVDDHMIKFFDRISKEKGL